MVHSEIHDDLTSFTLNRWSLIPGMTSRHWCSYAMQHQVDFLAVACRLLISWFHTYTHHLSYCSAGMRLQTTAMSRKSSIGLKWPTDEILNETEYQSAQHWHVALSSTPHFCSQCVQIYHRNSPIVRFLCLFYIPRKRSNFQWMFFENISL